MVLIAANATWEYQTTTNDPPVDPYAVAVPPTGWTAGGVAPFGNDPDDDGVEPNTDVWGLQEGLWIRRNVVLNGAYPVKVSGFVDNTIFVYFDGEFIGSVNPTVSSAVGYWAIVIPRELCTAGTHTIALLCQDDDGMTSDRVFVSAVADYLPALASFQPRAPVSEKLSWLTDVQTSKDGTEDRTQYRIKARQEFKFTYPVDGEMMRRAFLTVYSQRHKQWLVPIWTQAQRVGAVAQGDQEVSVTTGYSDYREQGLALLWQAYDRYQIVNVQSLTSDTLGFCNAADEFTDAWVMPVRLGFLPVNPVKELAGHRAQYELTFQIEDNIDLAPAAPAQYQGEDIYFEAGLFSGDTLSDDIIGALELQDEELGIVKYYAPWLNAKVAHSHRVLAEGPAEAWGLREWLYRRLGRFRGFWQPSFEGDLKCLNTGTVADHISIPAADDYAAFGSLRTHIAVEAKDGWYAREITSTTELSSTVLQLNLDSEINVAATDILRVCWLGFKRLNSDTVELNWPGAGICEVEVRLLELNG